MPRSKLLVAVLVLILVLSGIAMFSFMRSPWFQQPTPVRSVVYAYRDAITGIDPSVEDDTGIMVLHLVYETLLRYDPVRDEYQYVLAKEVERVDNNTWRVVLRDAKFHDGSPVTAHDVRFSILRSKALYDEKGLGAGWIWECLEDVEVLDEKSLNIKTKFPCDVRISLAASYSAFIYSRKVVELSGAGDPLSEKLINWFNSGNAIGSGPYKLEKYEPDKMVVLSKFREWWGWESVNNPNAPDTVIIRIVEDPGEQERLLRTGYVDIASSVPITSISTLRKDGYGVIAADTFHNFILMFNTRRWPTNITEFRLAIAYAIPWDKIVDQALGGYGRKGSGLLPHGFPGYSPKWEFHQDLEKARELLESVDLLNRDLKVSMVIVQGYEEEERFALILKDALAGLGIELQIEALPWDQVKERGAAVWSDPEEAPHLIINDWWPTYIIPYDYFSFLECLEPEEGIINYWNWAGYCNKNFDELLSTAYEESLRDLKGSLHLYDEIQKIAFEDMPAVNLWDKQHVYLINLSKVRFGAGALNSLYTYVIFFQYVEVLK